jgi:hypothetical protein
MGRNVRITCVDTRDERISHVGGVDIDRRRWLLTLDEAIEGIERGKWHFYVERPAGEVAWVVVAVSAGGSKYLTTQRDGDLRSLPPCPP